MSSRQIFATYDWKARPVAERFTYCPRCAAELVVQEIDHQPRPFCPQCGYIRFRNPAPAVGILIVDGDRVLLGKRTGELGGGQWALPSGYIEWNDDFLTASIREAREETGLDIEILGIVNVESAFLAPAHHFLAVYVLARVLGGELAASDDLQAVGWFPLAGPLPDMAFQSDVGVIETYARTRSSGLPVQPEYARPRPEMAD